MHRVSITSGAADVEGVSDGLGDGLSANATVSKALAIIVTIRVFFFIILLFFLSVGVLVVPTRRCIERVLLGFRHEGYFFEVDFAATKVYLV